ncbi:MAG: CoA pyrophosphatase [Porticoccaceae bacterium]
MLDLIKDKLQHRPPYSIHPLVDGTQREAAVLLALTRSADPRVVFIRRAVHLNSHQGQVAFPGGMWEPADTCLLDTALRESEEEIALPRSQVEVVAALEPKVTIFSVRVSPFVGFIPEGLQFVPELAELDAVFQVPLSYLLDEENYTRTKLTSAGSLYDAPCVLFEGFCIWGFTFRVLLDFLDETLGFRPELNPEIHTLRTRA